MSFAWILAVLFLQRMGELALCRRNRRALIAGGGKEFYPETYPVMVALHTFFFLSLAWESYPWRVPMDTRTTACLAGLVAVTALRYVTIATLGGRWTTRIVSVPGSKVSRAGPYRFFRHPNYLVIVLEFLLFPLLLRAPFTLFAFSLANLVVLRQRIRLEEKVLRETTDYGERFP
ncbi:MAG: isoprenylcysteine carboxylmethyltransferase family protein [Candidatus Deferrimicrobiaceae bacterium]